MKEFAKYYNVRPLYGRGFMLDVLLKSYEEFVGHVPERKPRIAIVDLPGVPSVKEFELFREFFEANGYPSVICTPQELEFSNHRLSAGGQKIDIVYKRLLVNEYLPIIDEYPALLNAYRAGAICMVNRFRSKLIQKKALFAVLTDKRYAPLFSDAELVAIRAHVPWTRVVRDEQSDYEDAPLDLLEFIRHNSQRLVLKPNDDYGGHGITIGWNVDQTAWDAAIEQALANGYYPVQERVATARETFSAFPRLSYTELANVSSGGGMVPTYIVSQK